MRHAGHQRRGAQVGVQSQSLAQPEQAGLGAQRAVGSVVTGCTDRRQQYGVGLAGSLQGAGRQGIALRIDRVDAWKLVDSALAALKESGELAKIIDRWL